MPAYMGVQGFGDTTDIRYYFKVGVITLVADGREIVIILLCNRNRIFKQNSDKLNLGLKSFTIDICIRIRSFGSHMVLRQTYRSTTMLNSIETKTGL